ncbi:MAG TPA: hypothetical protein VF787_03400 [Thermoanaerobaculia bacterium]
MKRTEKQELALCDGLVKQLSNAGRQAIVHTNPPHRMKQTLGVPDRRYRVFGFCLAFESKAEHGKLTREQHAYLTAELDHGALAACGTFDDLHALLVELRSARTTGNAELAIRSCRRIIGAWSQRGFRGEPAPKLSPGKAQCER